MKKLLAIILCLSMVFAFVACGKADTGSNSDSTPASDLAYVQEKGKLVVGVTVFEPMDYQDKDGKWVGFDADMANAFAKELGVSFATVNRWESGKTKPTYKTMKLIDDYCRNNSIDFDIAKELDAIVEVTI